MKRLISIALFALLLAVPAGQARADEVTIENLTFGNLVNGSLIKEDIAGKVVLVEFWGAKSDESKIVINNLNAFYRKVMQDTMSFEMIAIEAQSSGIDATQAIVDAAKIPYPVAASGGLAGYELKAIPTRILFDHTGKIIHEAVGPVTKDTFNAIAAAIKDAPHPLLGEFDYQKLSKEARWVEKGQSWGKVLAGLRETLADEAADPDEKNEAGIMMPRLEGHAKRLMEKAAKILPRNMVMAVEAYADIRAKFRGDIIEDEAEARMKEIMADPKFKLEEFAWLKWAKVEEIYEKNGFKNRGRNKEMLELCNMLLDKCEGTAGAREASAFKPGLETAIGDMDAGGDFGGGYGGG